jgi:hypothetical protein
LINGILAAEEALASRVAYTFRTYPRQITAAIAALLLSAGGGAFAVASLGPDAAELPVKQVFEAVTPRSFAPKSPVRATRPKRCCADWASTTPQQPPTCAAMPRLAWPCSAASAAP